MMDSQGNVDRASDSEPAVRFVPPSLLRVRRFLFEYGMPIVPWATAEQVLDEFHEILATRKADTAFWEGIRVLLKSLQSDLRERLAGDAQHNEILPLLLRQDLLDELQEQLRFASGASGGFLGTVRRLSPQCSSVLLLLGVAVTVGCGARTSLDNLDDSGLSSAGGASSIGGMGSTGGTHSNSTTFAGTGGQSVHGTGGATSCAFTEVKGAISSCGLVNSSLVACIQTLNASWRDGLNALLACKTCDEVITYLTCLQMRCSSLPAGYLESLLSSCYQTVYMGVRLEV